MRDAPYGEDSLELLDAATFRVVLKRERARADRTQAPLSLLMFDVSRTARDSGVHALLSGRGGRSLRCSDAAGRAEDGRLALMLPETGRHGAHQLADQLLRLLPESERVRFEVLHYPEQSQDDDHTEDGTKDGGRRTDRFEPPRRRVEVSAVGRPPLRLLSDAPCGSQAPADLAVSGEAEPLRPLFFQPLPAWKRVLDVVGASALILLFLPLMVATALAVKLTSRGPLVFRQVRCGIGGRPFTLYKFRTMCVGADEMKAELLDQNEQEGPVFKLKDDPRVTAVGRFLRRTSVDELPQLFNVLKGDMSLVGPRPPIPSETDRYEQWQRRRLECIGGLTGIWQVSGRSEVDFRDWVRMDILYQRRRSFLTDIAILLRTVPAVVRGRGAC